MAGPDEAFPHAEVRAALTALGNARQDLDTADTRTTTVITDAYDGWTGGTFDEYARWSRRRHEQRRALETRIDAVIDVLQAAQQATG